MAIEDGIGSVDYGGSVMGTTKMRITGMMAVGYFL